MKAIHLIQFGIDNLHLVNIPVPSYGENEVLVRTTAVSLQYLDLIVVEGNILPDLPLPHIPVSEGVGVVERVGRNVARWKKGDRVLIPFIPRWEAGAITTYANQVRTGLQRPGTLAEFSAQPENTLAKAPDNLNDEESAALPVAGLTAWTYLVSQGNIKAGQTILVQGSGGVSLFALQIAKLFGLKIIVTTGSKDKELKLKALGAEHVINYIENPKWSSEVRRLTNGVGVDIVLDVGGRETIPESILSCKEGGFIGLTGFLTGGSATIDIVPVIVNYLRLQGYSVGSTQELEALVRAIEVNNLRPVVDRAFPLEKTKDAFQRFKSGEVFGKVIIKI